MIQHIGNKYKVVSESGKNLSGPTLTLPEAKKRLAQVEYFKNKGK